MTIPLSNLVSHQENVYELTVASVKRAKQITMAGDVDVVKHDGKIVSAALEQVLKQRVQYRVEEE